MLPANQTPPNLAAEPPNLAAGNSQYRPPQPIQGTSVNNAGFQPNLAPPSYPYAAYIGPSAGYHLPSCVSAGFPLSVEAFHQAVRRSALPPSVSTTPALQAESVAPTPVASSSGISRAPARRGNERMRDYRARQKSGQTVNTTQYEQDLANPDADGNIISARQLIIQWLQQPDNYRSVVGKSLAVKENVAGRVRELKEEAGCRVGRTNSAVAGKIKEIIDKAKLGADECTKTGWGVGNDGFASVEDKKNALFPEYWALEEVMHDTGTARPMHLHQSTAVPKDDFANARAVMLGHRPDEDEGSDEEFGPEKTLNTATTSGGGSPLANPPQPSPEQEGPPKEFESRRAEELYRRSLAHRTRDAVDAILIDSEGEETAPPNKKQNRGPDKKRARSSKTVSDTVTKADEAMLSKVEQLRQDAVKAMEAKLVYEKEKDSKEDDLRRREVAAREREVGLQVATGTIHQRDEFVRFCQRFPQDWNMAGRLAFGDKQRWDEVKEDMLAYAAEEMKSGPRIGE
ncbi:hypothetical protein QFC24_002484 [Naganishia onofrii]|uniref:Uncharacterized protein n=1 Tax=Naganishia onofrii TaxID=1851511 RepID=A0ACC2XQQ5_9TREE|nr:hypothetical protein QFC24_002484 [Naganishia onofrii]